MGFLTRNRQLSKMDFGNLGTRDHFAEAQKGGEDIGQEETIHIRIQQRNGRKTLTTVQGIDSEFDLKKIARACKKEFACNGTVIMHKEYGEVLSSRETRGWPSGPFWRRSL